MKQCELVLLRFPFLAHYQRDPLVLETTIPSFLVDVLRVYLQTAARFLLPISLVQKGVLYLVEMDSIDTEEGGEEEEEVV
jgi:hypothetical protein